MIELVDVSRIQWRFDRASRRVPVAEPWTSPIAEILDSKTLDSGCATSTRARRQRRSDGHHGSGHVGCEPDAVSMLHAVRYVKAAGGLAACSTSRAERSRTGFPAHPADRAPDGRGTRSPGCAECRRAQRRATRRRGHHRRLRPRRYLRQGRHPGDPPAHQVGIEFIPELPADTQACAALAAGLAEQGVRRLRDPFWRENGCSGEAVSDEGPCSSRSTSAPLRRGPASFSASPTRIRSTPFSPDNAVSVRWPVSPRCSATRRCSRSTTSTTVGGQGFRARRPDGRGTAGFVDQLRAVATQTGRTDLLGRDRDRRRVDRVPRRCRPVGAASGGRGARGAVRARLSGRAPQRDSCLVA